MPPTVELKRQQSHFADVADISVSCKITMNGTTPLNDFDPSVTMVQMDSFGTRLNNFKEETLSLNVNSKQNFTAFAANGNDKSASSSGLRLEDSPLRSNKSRSARDPNFLTR